MTPVKVPEWANAIKSSQVFPLNHILRENNFNSSAQPILRAFSMHIPAAFPEHLRGHQRASTKILLSSHITCSALSNK
jgi:hypothetical protein